MPAIGTDSFAAAGAVGISQKIVTVGPLVIGFAAGREVRGKKVGVIGFACILVMSYGCGRIGTTLIPDKRKPTVTWGRKAMGQRCLPPQRQ